LATTSLALGGSHRPVTDARATGLALAMDHAAAVDLDDLDLSQGSKCCGSQSATDSSIVTRVTSCREAGLRKLNRINIW
jgi:hypothetical protein